MERVIVVDGIACDKCKRDVEEILYDLPGVRSVQVDVKSGHVRIQATDELQSEDVKVAIHEVGYTIKEFVDIF